MFSFLFTSTFLQLVNLSIYHLDNLNGELKLFDLTKSGAFPIKSILLSDIRNVVLHVIF